MGLQEYNCFHSVSFVSLLNAKSANIPNEIHSLEPKQTFHKSENCEGSGLTFSTKSLTFRSI